MAATKAETMQALFERLQEQQRVLENLAKQIIDLLKQLPEMQKSLEDESVRFNATFGSDLMEDNLKELITTALGLTADEDMPETTSDAQPETAENESSIRYVEGNRASDVTPDIDRIAFSHLPGEHFTYLDVHRKLDEEGIPHHVDWISTRLSKLRIAGKIRLAGKEVDRKGNHPRNTYATLGRKSRKRQRRAAKSKRRAAPELNIAQMCRDTVGAAGRKGLTSAEVWGRLQEKGAPIGKKGTMSVALRTMTKGPHFERTPEGYYRVTPK